MAKKRSNRPSQRWGFEQRFSGRPFLEIDRWEREKSPPNREKLVEGNAEVQAGCYALNIYSAVGWAGSW